MTTPETERLVVDYLEEAMEVLRAQLMEDHKRWGDTWLERGIVGQEKRTFERFRDYWDQYKNGGAPLPWMKIIGGALICWIREQHPEIVRNPDDSCEELQI